MIKLNLTLLTALLLTAAAAQTTYTYAVPAGTSCTTTINGCTLHDLTTLAVNPTFPGGSTPWGYFVGGSNIGALFAFQLYQGQNAAAGAVYCGSNGNYTETPRLDLGPTAVEWTLDCISNSWTNGSGAGELGNVGPYRIVVDLITHSSKVTKIVYRWRETFTIWSIDQGSVSLTPISST